MTTLYTAFQTKILGIFSFFGFLISPIHQFYFWIISSVKACLIISTTTWFMPPSFLTLAIPTASQLDFIPFLHLSLCLVETRMSLLKCTFLHITLLLKSSSCFLWENTIQMLIHWIQGSTWCKEPSWPHLLSSCPCSPISPALASRCSLQHVRHSPASGLLPLLYPWGEGFGEMPVLSPSVCVCPSLASFWWLCICPLSDESLLLYTVLLLVSPCPTHLFALWFFCPVLSTKR